MRFPKLPEALWLHRRVVETTGGQQGIRNLGGLLSALAQPMLTFDGEDLYPTLFEKVAALAFSVASNHPFVDGNKRTAHALLEVTLILNGFDITASVDEQEELMLNLAKGTITRQQLVNWLIGHTRATA